MSTKRIYSPFEIVYNGSISIENFPGIIYDDANIIFQTNQAEINLRALFNGNNVNTMKINSKDVTLIPKKNKFFFTDNLINSGEAFERAGGFKKKTYKKKTKRRSQKKRKPRKSRKSIKRRQTKRRLTKRRR